MVVQKNQICFVEYLHDGATRLATGFVSFMTGKLLGPAGFRRVQVWQQRSIRGVDILVLEMPISVRYPFKTNLFIVQAREPRQVQDKLLAPNSRKKLLTILEGMAHYVG